MGIWKGSDELLFSCYSDDDDRRALSSSIFLKNKNLADGWKKRVQLDDAVNSASPEGWETYEIELVEADRIRLLKCELKIKKFFGISVLQVV